MTVHFDTLSVRYRTLDLFIGFADQLSNVFRLLNKLRYGICVKTFNKNLSY